MRLVTLSALLVAASVYAGSHDDTCRGAEVEIFGGRLTIPCGFRLKLEFSNTIRFLKLEVDPRQPYGNIYIGKISDLPQPGEREFEASEHGATIERRRLGNLTVEIEHRTSQQLLRDAPVTHVSVLIYDQQHYVRAIGTDPNLWQQLLEHCDGCGQ